MRLVTILILSFIYCFDEHLVSAGVSVEFSSLLSDADKLLVAQMLDGGQSASEASEISGRAPKMAYTTFEESEKLRMKLLHRTSRATRNEESRLVHESAGNSSLNLNSDKSHVAKESKAISSISKSSNSRVGGGHYDVGEARTVPLLFMGMFGLVEFFVLSAVALALITPVIGSLLLVIKFMFTAGLIMIG